VRPAGATLLALAVAVSLGIGLAAGSVALSPAEVWRGLRGLDPSAAVIVRELRAPRVLLAFMVGGSLAVCGAALQAMIRNPLAEPYLLGLSGGAGLGAVIALATRAAGAWSVPVAAFLGAIAAVGLVYRLSLVAGQRLDPRVLLLAGVVVGSFAGALMSAIIVLADSSAVRNAFLWLLGGFGSASWQALGIFTAYAVLPLGVIGWHARALDLLALGEEPAHHLGAEVERTRRLVYGSTALLTAASVAACGIIGFVGLVIRAVRTLTRPPHRNSAAVFRRRVLPVLDVVARTVVRPLSAGRRHHRVGRCRCSPSCRGGPRDLEARTSRCAIAGLAEPAVDRVAAGGTGPAGCRGRANGSGKTTLVRALVGWSP
jgi:iron complex transport system permease protein